MEGEVALTVSRDVADNEAAAVVASVTAGRPAIARLLARCCFIVRSCPRLAQTPKRSCGDRPASNPPFWAVSVKR